MVVEERICELLLALWRRGALWNRDPTKHACKSKLDFQPLPGTSQIQFADSALASKVGVKACPENVDKKQQSFILF